MSDTFPWVALGFVFVGMLAIVATAVAFAIRAKKFAWPLIIINGTLMIAGWVMVIAFRKYEAIGFSFTMLGMLFLSVGILIRKDRKKQE